MANPSTEEKVFAGNEVRFVGGTSIEQGANLLGQFRAHFLVRVEREDPVSGALCYGGVLLGSEALPVFDEKFRANLVRGYRSAIGRTVVDDDDFTGPADTRKSAGQVGFFVLRDDRDRKGERHELWRKCNKSDSPFPVSRNLQRQFTQIAQYLRQAGAASYLRISEDRWPHSDASLPLC